MISIRILILALSVHGVSGYPTGAPDAVCCNGAPHHGYYEPQFHPAPYVVEPDSAVYREGVPINVVIRGIDNTSFKGFLLRAISTDRRIQDVYGGFKYAGDLNRFEYHEVSWFTNTTLPQCMTHSPGTSDDGTSRLNFTWTPPSLNYGELILVCSFVRHYDEFWVNVPSRPLRPHASLPKAAVIGEDISAQPDALPSPVSECGETQACVLYPNDCEPDDCQAAFLFRPSRRKPGYWDFTLMGPTEEGWLGVGFSHDEDMEDDHVYACVVAERNERAVIHGYNVPGPTKYFAQHNLGDVTNRRVAVIDGKMYCSFTAPDRSHLYYTYWVNTSDPSKATPVRGWSNFDLEGNSYYVFVTWGPVVRDSVSVLKHKVMPLISSEKVSFGNNTDITYMFALPFLTRLHATIGTLAWLLLAAHGMFIARHGRTTTTKCAGRAAWILAHMIFMIVTAIAVIGAIALVFIEREGWTDDGSYAHAILALCSIGFLLANIIMGFVRPKPDHSLRFLFNFGHRIVLTIAAGSAVVAIFFGIHQELLTRPFRNDLFVLMVIWIGLIVIYDLVIGELLKLSQRSSGGDAKDADDAGDKSSGDCCGGGRLASFLQFLHVILLLPPAAYFVYLLWGRYYDVF